MYHHHRAALAFFTTFLLKASAFSLGVGVFGRSSSVTSTSKTLLNSAPSLIVFDLDNTLWTPELYQLRKLSQANQYPVAHQDVKLFPAARDMIIKMKKDDTFANTKFAVASRTKSVDWAHDLLEQFELREWLDYIEIFPGDKKQHFHNLRRNSGIGFEQMLFFDDARDGKYGNCEPVSSLGVLSVHCPNGICEESIWVNAISKYNEWSVHNTPGTIVEWDGSITTTSNTDPKERFKGRVKYLNREKRFGFIDYGEGDTQDMFFHFNDLPHDDIIEENDELTFTVITSRSGKDAASNIEMTKKSDSDECDLVEMHIFSMNLPFAALLSNGYKTLETRNGTMFTPYEPGTKMLLHVGQRTYPDGDRHIDVMKSGGLDDDEIKTLKSLPPGFGKGMAVAIVEIGETFETTLEQRCQPDFQRSVGAFGADSGMRATEIRRVEYLKQPLKVSARGGVFKAKIDKNSIPDGWLNGEDEVDRCLSGKKTKQKVYYSESF